MNRDQSNNVERLFDKPRRGLVVLVALIIGKVSQFPGQQLFSTPHKKLLPEEDDRCEYDDESFQFDQRNKTPCWKFCLSKKSYSSIFGSEHCRFWLISLDVRG